MKNNKNFWGLRYTILIIATMFYFSVLSGCVLPTRIATSSNESDVTEELEPKEDTTYEMPDDTTIIPDLECITLCEKNDEYSGQWVRVFGRVLRSSTNDGVEYIKLVETESIASVYCNLRSDQLKVDYGTYVAIIGKVDEGSKYSVDLNYCYIDLIGQEAQELYEPMIAQKKAEIEAARQKEKEEFINSCESYRYDDIARNPNNYNGTKAVFKGKVIQVLEDGKSITLRVNVTATRNQFATDGYLWSDTLYVTYYRSDENESRILEDDVITMYGTLTGLKTYTTILGSSVSIPSFSAEYIELKY